jgi:hypothetical protein
MKADLARTAAAGYRKAMYIRCDEFLLAVYVDLVKGEFGVSIVNPSFFCWGRDPIDYQCC